MNAKPVRLLAAILRNCLPRETTFRGTLPGLARPPPRGFPGAARPHKTHPKKEKRDP
jgi:hypothetical protein